MTVGYYWYGKGWVDMSTLKQGENTFYHLKPRSNYNFSASTLKQHKTPIFFERKKKLRKRIVSVN